jgi:hypothetical protein
MLSVDELLSKYEVAVNKYRTRPMTEDEVIIAAWSKATQLLNERAFSEADAVRRKAMRMGAREIRKCMAHAGHVTNKDLEMIKTAEMICADTMTEVLEGLVVDVDAMARLIMAQHVQHRRINACRIRVVRAVNVMAQNVDEIKMGKYHKDSPETQKEGQHE